MAKSPDPQQRTWLAMAYGASTTLTPGRDRVVVGA